MMKEKLMVKGNVNPNSIYYNYNGKFPEVTLKPQEAACIPPETANNHPKRITDTTLRDGTQDPLVALFPHETKLCYFDLLHKLDNGTGCIENLEVFIYQKRDRWVLEKMLERGYEYPRVTTWTRATPKDIRLMVELTQGRIKETGMLASASDHHIFDKLKFRSKEAAIEKYLETIMTAVENGIRPRVHLEDATKADICGWVIPFITRVMKETNGLASFRVCDTLGWGVPDPYAEIPSGIPKLISMLFNETGAELEFHGHNDFGLAAANSVAAWIYGCNRVNTSFAGLGERTGNTPLEQMVASLIRLYGDPGLNLPVLAEIADLLEAEVYPVSSKAPIIGRRIFTTQAGLHQTGVQKQQDAPGGFIYLPYAASMVGRENAELHLVGSLSGMDGLVAVLNKEMEAAGEKKRYTLFSKTVKEVYDRVHAAFDGKWDERAGKYIDPHVSFFEPEHLLEMVKELEKESEDGNSV